jgi:molecular chaperone HscB
MSSDEPGQTTALAAPLRCGRCNSELLVPVVCRECHNVMPEPKGLTHFDRLGLPKRFELDLEELERKYLAWSRELHPDYFSDRPDKDQQLSLDLSAGLNDAYRTLKNPFIRAEYLLALERPDPDARSNKPPAGFLEEMLEIREQIAEIQSADDRAKAEGQALELEDRLGARRAKLLEQIQAAFAKLVSLSAGSSEREPTLVQIEKLLSTSRYVNGLLHELTVNT